MEGGAEFLPRPLLPPRPLHCWIFLGFLSQMQRAHEAKKRGRGRGPEDSHRLFFFKRNRKHNHTIRSGPLPLPRWFSDAPAHTSVCLRAFPQSLVATGVRSRHTDVCLARKTVSEGSGSRPLLDRARGKNRIMNVMHHLLTDFYKKYFLTLIKNGKMYL